MSALLDAVTQARELRDAAGADWERADAEFRRSLARAHEQHSLREIGRAAGLTFAGVRYLIQHAERGERR